MLKSTTIIDFLNNRKLIITNQWKKQFFNAGEELDQLLVILLNEADYTKQLKPLAEKVAKKYHHNSENLKEFLQLVSKGRLIFISEIMLFDISHEDKLLYLEYINKTIDYFISQSLSSYTELQTKEQEEEYYLISQTHKDRLTLLGQITSSFVHEFRNPLTSIMGFIQLLQSEQPGLKYLDIISKELDQLNLRITQFLNLSKKEDMTLERDPFSISELVNEVIDFLYPSILEVNASIHNEVEENMLISGSKEEIRQVLFNIILNALDVISETGQPSIYIQGSHTLSDGIELMISNNGPKINEDVLPTIFEPFMTTKKRGTGLGLFVCREIIQKHKGTLTCTSDDNLTTFTIHLPK